MSVCVCVCVCECVCRGGGGKVAAKEWSEVQIEANFNGDPFMTLQMAYGSVFL